MILSYSKEQFKAKIIAGIKIHTIREDKTNRWKLGMTIQQWLYSPRNPQKHPHQFSTDRCEGLQKIEIKGDFFNGWQIKIDGIEITNEQLEILAINDGFESSRQFFLWFNKGFKGKIIHWTNFRY